MKKEHRTVNDSKKILIRYQHIRDLPLIGGQFDGTMLKVIHKIYKDFVLVFRDCYWKEFKDCKTTLNFLGLLHDYFDNLLDESIYYTIDKRKLTIKKYIILLYTELSKVNALPQSQRIIFEEQLKYIASELFYDDKEIRAIIE